MSISDKLTTIRNAIKAIKQAIIDKGQTPSGDITTYPDAIGNITSGGVQYIPREVTSDGELQVPATDIKFNLSENIKTIGEYGLAYALMNCTSVTSIDLSHIEKVKYAGLSHSFYGNKLIASVNLSSLTVAENSSLDQCFYGCTSVTSADLSNLETIGFYALTNAFQGCGKLNSVNLSSLKTVSKYGLNQAFMFCFSLKELKFPSLTSSCFTSEYDCHLHNMLFQVPGCTVHFPSNLESVIGDWSDVTGGFGGTNTTVLFDLPATS